MSEDPTRIPSTNQPTTLSNGEPSSDLWARVRGLEWEARFLDAKCDDLLHSCRDLLVEVGRPGPLTAN